MHTISNQPNWPTHIKTDPTASSLSLVTAATWARSNNLILVVDSISVAQSYTTGATNTAVNAGVTMAVTLGHTSTTGILYREVVPISQTTSIVKQYTLYRAFPGGLPLFIQGYSDANLANAQEWSDTENGITAFEPSLYIDVATVPGDASTTGLYRGIAYHFEPRPLRRSG